MYIDFRCLLLLNFYKFCSQNFKPINNFTFFVPINLPFNKYVHVKNINYINSLIFKTNFAYPNYILITISMFSFNFNIMPTL